MKEFYVYGLIDPRTNSIFYIGKGKGKRVLRHFNEKEKISSNHEKIKIVSEIQKEGLEVGYILIWENLNEDVAFLLERLLIYRIGRRIFDEGVLTNTAPGGRWNKDESFFLNKSEIQKIELITTEFPELTPVLEKYPHVACEFKGLRCPYNSQDETLYVYNTTENLFNEYNIDSFIQKFNLGYALEIINGLKNTPEPVYAYKRIWSKTKFKKIEDISKIPFQDFDIVEFEFVKQASNSILQRDDFLLHGLYPDGSKRTELTFDSNINTLTLTYFYPNGNKKHITNYLEGRLNGKSFFWYSNGQLKEESEYINNKLVIKYCYSAIGNLEKIAIHNEIDGSKIYKKYYENGQLMNESIHKNSLKEICCIITCEYSEMGSLIRERKEYYVGKIHRDCLRGYEKIFYDTGEIETEIDYTNGTDNKIIKQYMKNGEMSIKQRQTISEKSI